MEEKSAPPISGQRPESSSSSSSDEPAAAQYEATRSSMQRSRSEPNGYGLRRLNSLAMMDENDQRELQRLATSLTRIRTRNESIAEEGHPAAGVVSSDPALDPSSASFDLHRYLEHVIGLLRKEGITPAQAGVAFKDVSVSGSGDALQLQHTIGDWVQAPLRLGEHFSLGKKPHRKILHSFDGLVNSGELLIVLGRPGSGCSTLLKTMTGQLHGLNVQDKSVIHYNGIPQDQMMKEFKGEAIYNQEVRLCNNILS